jgi:arsenite methyltransferase
VTSEDVKTCCADLYASDWARLLLGESLHPGGLALTERLATLLDLRSDSVVLDVAAGRGTSALHLAGAFGCRVVGVDYSPRNVEIAPGRGAPGGPGASGQFRTGDAERLVDVGDGRFDAVICEYAFCTFPDKAAAAREIARVLRPGGRFGLSDLTRSGPLPQELESLLGWVACLADAQPVARYVHQLEAAGLRVELDEPHDDAVAELVRQVRGRLLGAKLLATLKQLDLRGVDLSRAAELARCAADTVERGIIGYSLIVATKPVADQDVPTRGQAAP